MSGSDYEFNADQLSAQILKLIHIFDSMAYVILSPDLTIIHLSPSLAPILRADDLQPFVGRLLTTQFGEFVGAEEGLAAIVDGQEPVY